MARITKTTAHTIGRLGLSCQNDLMDLFDPQDLTQEGHNLLTLFINHGFTVHLTPPLFLMDSDPKMGAQICTDLHSLMSSFFNRGYFLQLDLISPRFSDAIIHTYLSMHSAEQLANFCVPETGVKKHKKKKDPSTAKKIQVPTDSPANSLPLNALHFALLLPPGQTRVSLAQSVALHSTLPQDAIQRIFCFKIANDCDHWQHDYSLAGRIRHLLNYLEQSDQLLKTIISHPDFHPEQLRWLKSTQAVDFFQQHVFNPLLIGARFDEDPWSEPELFSLLETFGFLNQDPTQYGALYAQTQFVRAEAWCIAHTTLIRGSSGASIRL